MWSTGRSSSAGWRWDLGRTGPTPSRLPAALGEPVRLGELLDGAFQYIRAHPRVVLGVSAVVAVISVLLQAPFQASFGSSLQAFVGPTGTTPDLAALGAFVVVPVNDLIGEDLVRQAAARAQLATLARDGVSLPAGVTVYRAEGELTPDDINAIWMEVQIESLGDVFEFMPGYETFWTYVPHFVHSPFYVYAYAFGDCLVNALYSVFQGGHPGFEQKYLDMLRAGGTKRHKELLAPFGLDASDPAFWRRGLDVISGFIDELERA